MPTSLHAHGSWQADFETVAAAVNAVDGSPGLALRALLLWFWEAPLGPIKCGRLKASFADPSHLAKYVSRDLDAAYDWWASQRDVPPRAEAAQ